MSNFYEEAKANFAGIPEDRITDDLCGIYLSNQRLKDSYGGNYSATRRATKNS